MGNLLKMCGYYRCLFSHKRLLTGALWEQVLSQIFINDPNHLFSSIKFMHEKWMGKTADLLDSTNKIQNLS